MAQLCDLREYPPKRSPITWLENALTASSENSRWPSNASFGGCCHYCGKFIRLKTECLEQ